MYVMSKISIQEDQIMYTRESGLTSGRQQMDELMRPCLPESQGLSACRHMNKLPPWLLVLRRP